MIRVAIYTLTRDRLEYTQRSFASLKENAGYPYDHFVVDNGSEDGTREWLVENAQQFARLDLNTENQGISKASNQALQSILNGGYQPYDLIIKMDNDCEIKTPDIIKEIVSIYKSFGEYAAKYILSPRVEGINTQPTRGGATEALGHRIGLTAIVGGLFHIVPAGVYSRYMTEGGFPTDLPKAKGQDDVFCKWFKDNGGQIGYIEDFVVEHMDGTDNQAKRYPEYFERKWKEEI